MKRVRGDIAGVLSGISGVALALLLAAPAALAETSTDFTYSTAQHGYVTLTAAAFVSGRNDYTYANDGHGLHTRDPGTMCFVAPLQLPHRARVRNDVLIGYALEHTGAFTFAIYSQKLIDGHTTQLLYIAPSATDVGTYSLVGDPVTPFTIDNVNNGYYLQVCMSEVTAWFYSTRIGFTYTSAGD